MNKKRRIGMERIDFSLKARHRASGQIVELSSKEVFGMLSDMINSRLKEKQQFIEITSVPGITAALVIQDLDDMLRVRPLEPVESQHLHFELGQDILVRKSEKLQETTFQECCDGFYSCVNKIPTQEIATPTSDENNSETNKRLSEDFDDSSPKRQAQESLQVEHFKEDLFFLIRYISLFNQQWTT